MLLKNRILIGTFLALGTLAAGFWVTTQNFQARQSLEMHKSRLAMSQLFLEFVIGNENRSMAAQMKSVMRDRETIDAIEKNETASVAPRVVTTFRRLKTSAILDELHVSNSRGEVMLAFPEGSASSGAASLANKALERSKPVYGVALNNRRQLQLLVSFPVYKAGRPVGTISYAKDFGAIAQLIKQHGFAGVLVTDTDHRPVYQTDAGLFEQFEPLVLATAGESGRKLATDKRYFEAFTLPIHNSDGKLIAKFVEVADTTDASAAQLQAFWMTQGILAGLIVLSLAAMSIWLHMQFKPLGRFLQALGEVSRGNLEASFDGHENRDEIGAIVRTFRDFRAGLIDKQRQHERERQLAEDQQRADRKRLAEAFDQEVGAIVAHVSDSSSALSRTAETLSRTSSLASEEVQSATKASRQTSNSVQAVASAAEQMAMTIEEISGQVQQASGASRQAVEEALRANSQMQALQHTSDRISEITGLISAIADQTNLLALNATIEAARAGAAGRGFAVVASEVKSLANQSAKATNDIARQIGDIQNASLEATRSMESVNAAIERVEAISSAIAGAIEQQSAATREIAQSVDIVASSTADVDRSINGVAQRSTEVGSASHTVSTSSQAMLRQTDQLKEAVSRFLRQVKTG